MEIFLLIVRSLMLVLGSLMLVVFMLFQLWQRVPSQGIKFRAQDGITLGAVALIFALGTNSYWGLAAVLPMLLGKLLSQLMIQKNRVRGSGRWIEVQWTKMTPRGFQIPQQLGKELQKLPGDQHVLLPRQVGIWAVKYFLKSVKKNAGKGPVPMRAGQQAQAFEMVERLGSNIIKLEKGKTEQVALPFGVLKVTRL
ncbi:MAG: hypothetical protein RLZZ488_2036 [Pseudomonadota bacterium]|jgi:hypothetical protein